MVRLCCCVFLFLKEGVAIIVSRYYFWIVLLLLPSVNLLLPILNGKFLVGLLNFDLIINQFITLCFGAVAEELFFRGLLQNELLSFFKTQKLFVILWINILFGTLHLLNAFSNASIFYTVVQGLCAFGVGVSLSAVYYRMHRLIICMMIHALINITSVGRTYGAEVMFLTDLEFVAYMFVALIYFVVGIRLMKEE